VARDEEETTRTFAKSAALEAKRGGVYVKWGTVGTLVVLLLGGIWRYADARWTAAEILAAGNAEKLRASCDRTLILEQQAAADRQRADERQAYLQTQLAQIQTQLAHIQAELRRAARP